MLTSGKPNVSVTRPNEFRSITARKGLIDIEPYYQKERPLHYKFYTATTRPSGKK